jgi:hypothetical protein
MALKENEFKVTREQNTQQRMINTSEDHDTQCKKYLPRMKN